MNAGFRLPTRVDTEPAERTFDLRQYVNFLWRHWMFIGAVTALTSLIGVIYLARAIPLYTATTQVLLERPGKAPTETVQIYDGFGEFAFMENQLAIIKSDPLLGRVVLKERLVTPPQASGSEPAKESATSAEDESILN